MRNRGRRSRGSDDINLTPLLDVLFVILCWPEPRRRKTCRRAPRSPGAGSRDLKSR